MAAERHARPGDAVRRMLQEGGFMPPGMGRTGPKVQAGFVSFTEITKPDEHQSYNRWHLFDHLPEQFPLPGLVFGQRWVLPPPLRPWCHAEPPLDHVHYVTLYLMATPEPGLFEAFRALGKQLRLAGRFHEHRVSHLSGPLGVGRTAAAERVRVSPEAVPYRPCTGVHIRLEPSDGADERVPAALVEQEGVAGAWTFAGDPGFSPPALQPMRATWCWLDGEPSAVAATLGPPPAGTVFDATLATVDPNGPWDWFD